jgi:hypothetical protein
MISLREFTQDLVDCREAMLVGGKGPGVWPAKKPLPPAGRWRFPPRPPRKSATPTNP